MNTENILKLVDAIEAGDSSPQGLGFDMSTFRDNCGTTACIAGWNMFLFEPKTWAKGHSSNSEYNKAGQEHLGIDLAQCDELFLPLTELKYEDITPADAATVLRNLAQTGRVEWPQD